MQTDETTKNSILNRIVLCWLYSFLHKLVLECNLEKFVIEMYNKKMLSKKIIFLNSVILSEYWYTNSKESGKKALFVKTHRK